MIYRSEFTELIKKIHESDVFGIFTEIGCGQPLANMLFQVSGASNTVFLADSPYSESLQSERYGEIKRAVSAERVASMIEKNFGYAIRRTYGKDEKLINTVFASSFQVGNYNDKITHGWVAIGYKSQKLKCYHITIAEPLPRKKYMKKIGATCLHLLCRTIGLTDDDFRGTIGDMPNYVDQICEWANGMLQVPEVKETLEMMLNADNDTFISFNEKGDMCRLEELTRGKDDIQPPILIYKGSFNPPHIFHLEIAAVAKKLVGEKPILMISAKTHDKKMLSAEDLMQRLTYIKALGYPCIINKDGRFLSCDDYLKKRYHKRAQIIFLAGIDTFRRIPVSDFAKAKNALDYDFLDDDFVDMPFKNTKFLVADRSNYSLTDYLKSTEIVKDKSVIFERLDMHENGISSTLIRENLAAGKSVEDVVPESILKILTKI